MKKKLSPAERREENWGWIMVAPTIIGLFVLNIWPFIQTIYTSFCEHLKVYDLIYMMSDDTNPAMADMQSLMYLFYRSSFVAGDRGYGSAIVIWTVCLILLVTLIQFWGQKKWVTYDV